jgi:hypothetical protein
MIAIKAGASVIPTAIIGTNSRRLFPQFEIRFGKPIILDKNKADKDGISKFSDIIMSEIKNLLDE